MNYTNKFKLPRSIEDAVIKNTYDISTNTSNIISVTTLNNPPCIRQLSIRYWKELEEDISDNLWRILGSAVHEVLARIKTDNRLIEERIYVDMTTDKVITLSKGSKLEPEKGHLYVAGRPDIYDDITKSVEDYKITSVWAVKFEKEEWVEQLNCYAWFYHKLGFPIKSIHIHAILRDWRKSEAKKYDDYPKVAFKSIPIMLWPFKKQEEHILQRLELHKKAETLKNEDLPICTEKERWKNDIRCKEYCIVKKYCLYGKNINEK